MALRHQEEDFRAASAAGAAGGGWGVDSESVVPLVKCASLLLRLSPSRAAFTSMCSRPAISESISYESGSSPGSFAIVDARPCGNGTTASAEGAPSTSAAMPHPRSSQNDTMQRRHNTRVCLKYLSYLSQYFSLSNLNALFVLRLPYSVLWSSASPRVPCVAMPWLSYIIGMVCRPSQRDSCFDLDQGIFNENSRMTAFTTTNSQLQDTLRCGPAKIR